MNGERFRELAEAPNAQLEKLIRASRGPSVDSLVDCEWRGYNTSPLTAVLGTRKFIKGFFQTGSGVEGYNIPVRQNGLANPWIHLPSPEAPKRFGFFRVDLLDSDSPGKHQLAPLLLNYAATGRNAWYRPERVIRDYLVQPDPEDADLLLGKAYLALGPLWIALTFFILERLRAVHWRP